MEIYLDCPRRFYYTYLAGLPRRTDFPRLCGDAVHKHIRQLYNHLFRKYRKPPKPRPFFYENKHKAIQAWLWRWRMMVEEALREGRLTETNPYLEERFKRIGIISVARYWDLNLKRRPPLTVEKRLEFQLLPDVKLVGVIDQIWPLTLEEVALHRPELIVAGALRDGYDPVVIVDFKTGRSDYGYRRKRWGVTPTIMDRVRRQFPLHEGLQATIFTFLYEKVFGKKPVGFFLYPLRDAELFFTYRDERDYERMYSVINHFIENLKAESFPPHVDRHCETCEHLAPCRENKGFLLVSSESPALFGQEPSLPQVTPTGIEKGEFTQKRLKLKIPRRAAPRPAIGDSAMPPSGIRLLNLPWDGLKPSEELGVEGGTDKKESA